MTNQDDKQRWRTSVSHQERARQLRQEQTQPEALLWQHLRSRQLNNFKFRRQHPIGRFIVDFCCVDQRLVVEVDGASHSTQQEYDQARTEYLQAHGYDVLRFSNEQIKVNIAEVLAMIRQHLTENRR